MDRRRVVAVLIVVAIAVPLVIEGMTLLGLVGQYLGGDGTATPTAGETPVRSVGVGDDLLAETARSERVTTYALQSGDRWTLTVTVSVQNAGTTPYELRLGAVVTESGRTVEGSATTGELPPNASGTVTNQWTLPSGALPDRLAVTAVEHRDGGPVTLVEREVNLASVAVQG